MKTNKLTVGPKRQYLMNTDKGPNCLVAVQLGSKLFILEYVDEINSDNTILKNIEYDIRLLKKKDYELEEKKCSANQLFHSKK
jgi:hypothetical protein